jgi:hypothetical protein
MWTRSSGGMLWARRAALTGGAVPPNVVCPAAARLPSQTRNTRPHARGFAAPAVRPPSPPTSFSRPSWSNEVCFTSSDRPAPFFFPLASAADEWKKKVRGGAPRERIEMGGAWLAFFSFSLPFCLAFWALVPTATHVLCACAPVACLP